MMHIRTSNDVEYVRQLWKLSAKSVALYALVCGSHGLDMGNQKLPLWIGTIEQTIIIRVTRNIEWGMVGRGDGHCLILSSAFWNRQRPLSVVPRFLKGLLPRPVKGGSVVQRTWHWVWSTGVQRCDKVLPSVHAVYRWERNVVCGGNGASALGG